jgi:Putative adhesin
MKKYLLLLFIACQSTVLLAQDWNKAPYETKSLSTDAIKDVYVETSGGSIAVSGAAGEAPRVDVFVHANNNQELSKEDIKKRLDEDYRLEITVSNHELHVLAKRKHEGGFNWDGRKQLSISFKIYVPKNVDTHLGTSGGSIHLDNLSGNENFSTSGGSLHVEALNGLIKGETSGGSIDVSNSGSDINLETSGGSIHASNCHGKIKLETSGGSLHLEDLKGSINANTSGGSIQANSIEGELITGTSGGSVNLTKMACSLEASTSGGSMHVDMDQVGKYVKLDVSGGHVDLKLPGNVGMNLNLSADKINSVSVKNFSGEWEKTHIKGSINGGGIPVNVDASGSLNLTFN